MDGPGDCHTGVSQEERNKYCIRTHICGIYKNGTDDLICEAERDTDMRTNIWIPTGKERWEELGN